jgi:hypothetical protein
MPKDEDYFFPSKSRAGIQKASEGCVQLGKGIERGIYVRLKGNIALVIILLTDFLLLHTILQ